MEPEERVVTARVTTLKGDGAGAYYVGALPSYYLDESEPKGVWHGRGAALLGLAGEVDDRPFLRVMAGLHPAGPARHLGRAYGGESVRGFDVTASAPKSVLVLFAVGDERTRREVLAGHDAAVGAMLAWVEKHAHTRRRIGGEVCVVDAQGLVVAAFRQHTSRALDPQLHAHVVIANRVRSDDGRWLALDARTLKLDQRTLSAIYHSALRSELTDRLGVAWRERVNGIAEIDHVPDRVLEAFSSRTGEVARRVDAKLDRFRDTMDRDPTPRERWQLEREAVIDSRPPKIHGVGAAGLHAEWTDRLFLVGTGPSRILRDALDQTGPTPFEQLDRDAVLDHAITALAERQSSWRPAELTREIAAALPPLDLPAAWLVDLADGLTIQAMRERCVELSRPIPDGAVVRASDGRPITESVIDQAWSTPEILAEEADLIGWAERRSAGGVDHPGAPGRAAVDLSAPQADAAAAVAGTRALVLVVGPAGTGKTTALAPAVEQLQADRRPVFGAAPSAAAAGVLAAETGVDADTLDKLLAEHQRRGGPAERYNLPPGTTVIVDEAAMVPTSNLRQLAYLADTHAWRIALVGDPLQFSAVGRGGMFGLFIDAHGAIELDRVHRFSNAWERDASLRLRAGDTDVADLYDQHGRLHGGTATRMRHDAVEAWWDARQHGHTVALSAPSNDTVAELNRAAQERRLHAGQLDTNRWVDVGRYRLHLGDEVVTRENHRQLTTDQGRMVRNRDDWTITAIGKRGELTVTGSTGTVQLPTWYVNAHVELGYAQTSHATQGRTVDKSILVLDAPADVRGVYVPMTRGREANDAYIAVTGEQTAVDVFADSIGRNWIDEPAHARAAQLAQREPQRHGTLPADTLRQLHTDAATLAARIDQITGDLQRLPAEHTWLTNQRARTTTELDDAVKALQTAFDTIERYDTPLRRRRHEPELDDARRTIDRLRPRCTDLDAERAGYEQRLTDITKRLGATREQAGSLPSLNDQLEHTVGRLDDDARIRSLQVRHHPTPDVVEYLGPRPTSRDAGHAWDAAAGKLDQYNATWETRDQRRGPGHDCGLDRYSVAEGELRRAIQLPAQERHLYRGSPALGIGL